MSGVHAQREAGRLLALLADGDWVGAMARAEAALPLLISHAPDALEAVCDGIPPGRIASFPRWAALRTHLRMLRQVGSIGAGYAEPSGESGRETAAPDRLVVRSFRSTSLRARGRFADAADEADAAADALRRLGTAERAALIGWLPMLQAELGHSLLAAGRLADSRAVLADAVHRARACGDDRALLQALGLWALACADAGMGQEADARLEEFAAASTAASIRSTFVDAARLARARRSLDRLDLAEGLAMLAGDDGLGELGILGAAMRAMTRGRAPGADPAVVRVQLESSVGSAGSWRAASGYNAMVLQVARGTLLSLEGNHEAALIGYEELGPLPVVLSPMITVRRAAARLALGETARAEALAARIGARPSTRARAESLTVRAAARRRAGDTAGAAALFAEALAIAERDGVWTGLLQIPRDDLERLLPPSGAEPLRRILASDRRLVVPPAEGYLRLTAQQLQTLRAMSRTDTLGDAAALLSVSRETTKSHAREIYRRLGVTDRASALVEGHRRGLA